MKRKIIDYDEENPTISQLAEIAFDYMLKFNRLEAKFGDTLTSDDKRIRSSISSLLLTIYEVFVK